MHRFTINKPRRKLNLQTFVCFKRPNPVYLELQLFFCVLILSGECAINLGGVFFLKVFVVFQFHWDTARWCTCLASKHFLFSCSSAEEKYSKCSCLDVHVGSKVVDPVDVIPCYRYEYAYGYGVLRHPTQKSAFLLPRPSLPTVCRFINPFSFHIIEFD